MRPPNTTRWAVYADHLGGYMRRWIIRTPFGDLRLHHILSSDRDGDLHDHPFDFTSLLLTGGYVEHTPQGSRFWPRFSVVRKKAEDAHRLELVFPIWTLVFTRGYRRKWGFHTEKGWVYWRDYVSDAAWHGERSGVPE